MKQTAMKWMNHSACLVCGLVILLISLAAITSGYRNHSPAVSTRVSEGLHYLAVAESADPLAADTFYREKQKERMNALKNSQEKQALIEGLKNDETDVFPLFKDYVILGDSRAYGFSHFHFLEYSRVLAGGGDTILTVREHMDKIKNLNPSYIYLCYGINDAGIGIWKTPQSYAAEVLTVINELREALPDAEIIYSSIIWISDGAAMNPMWAQIYDFSDACRTMCQENGIKYVDNDEICLRLKEERWWSGDGIHLSKPFYSLWAKNLYLAILEE